MKKRWTGRARHPRQAVGIAIRELHIPRGVKVKKNGVNYNRRTKKWTVEFE